MTPPTEARLEQSLDAARFLVENAPGTAERQYAESIRWLLEKKIKALRRSNNDELARSTRGG